MTRVFFTTFFSWLIYTVHAIPKISRVGRFLYDDSGQRFYIKGIAYQPQGASRAVLSGPDNGFLEPSTFTDPLADGAACQRDLPFLQQLGVNALRIYSVDSTLNHDQCMSTFSGAGIYTILDLGLPNNGSIDRTGPTWTTNLLNEYTSTISTFEKYDNVLAYNVGNEVVETTTVPSAPFVKAAARDIKAFLKSKGSNRLVGYASIDGPADFKQNLAEYLSCDPSSGNSDATSIDIFGLNNYEWCGDSTFQSSYAGTTQLFENYNVVAYLSEFGCITKPPRLWTEVAAIFSSDMSPVWSGGLAFSYFPRSSDVGDYGMVTISADNTTVTPNNDFNTLKTQFGMVSFINSPTQSSAGASSFPSCPASSTDFAAPNALPPTPDNNACDCLETNLSCQFTPQTSNFSAIVGELLDTGCSLLGGAGGNCNDISADGQAGTYGRVSECDPTIKLSYVMSQFFEANKRDPQACSFAGNGTVNTKASTTVAAVAVASSCLSNPGATFTPSAAPTSGGGSSSGGSSGGGSSGGSGGNSGSGKGGAVGLSVEIGALVGVSVVTLLTAMSGVWVFV
ncbi:glycoside hydrolase family 72 protein [Panaeolus papilionaceus]|nr:glycoside hydrolase family 72 protein [Panaeolus papilionaceus]